jgi:hypothetical protein
LREHRLSDRGQAPFEIGKPQHLSFEVPENRYLPSSADCLHRSGNRALLREFVVFGKLQRFAEIVANCDMPSTDNDWRQPTSNLRLVPQNAVDRISVSCALLHAQPLDGACLVQGRKPGLPYQERHSCGRTPGS